MRPLFLALLLALAPSFIHANTDNQSASLTALSATSTVEVDQLTKMIVQTSGSWTATLVVEASTNTVIASAKYVTLTALQEGTTGSQASITAPGFYRFNVSGYRLARLRVSAYTSGTITASMQLGNGSDWPALSQGWTGSANDAQRLPTGTGVHASVPVTTAAATTLWTPAAGNKFRLMSGMIYIPSGAKSATPDNVMTLFDGTVTITTIPFALPSVAATLAGDIAIPMNFGNGYVSAISNTALVCTISANLTSSGAASIWVQPLGVEGVNP